MRAGAAGWYRCGNKGLCTSNKTWVLTRALFDPTIPIGRKNPQPVHPETPQPAKTLAQFRLLMFKPPFLSGMGPVWVSAPISGALVLFVFPCPFLSLQHPQGPRFSPSLNVAVGFLECWSLQRCRKRDCKMVCVLQPAEPTLQF